MHQFSYKKGYVLTGEFTMDRDENRNENRNDN